MTISNYSLAIMPFGAIAESVKRFKEKLKSEIGKSYGSWRAEAHISLDSFDADDACYPLVLAEYRRLVAKETPIEIAFSGFGHFDGFYPSFHVKVTDDSKERIKTLYSRIRQGVNPQIRKSYMRKWADESKEPHMTIGRKLQPQWIEKAYALFPHFEEQYLCDQLVIRQFRTELKQYQVIDVLPMQGLDGFASSLFD
jgi:2'-5' RNA ligase